MKNNLMHQKILKIKLYKKKIKLIYNMFSIYDYTEFPLVKVSFDGTIQNEQDFFMFTEQWIKLYEDQKEFNFEFDMKNMGLVNPYWSYRMATFISELKKREIHYLTSSKIINVNNFTYYLLKIIFAIQSPVAPVFIIRNDGSEIRIDP